MVESIGKRYKPWLIVCLVVLVGSLLMLAATMTIAFLSSGSGTTALWVIVLAVISGLGVGLGFLGLFLMMTVAGWSAWRETRRVRVLPPERID